MAARIHWFTGPCNATDAADATHMTAWPFAVTCEGCLNYLIDVFVGLAGGGADDLKKHLQALNTPTEHGSEAMVEQAHRLLATYRCPHGVEAMSFCPRCRDVLAAARYLTQFLNKRFVDENICPVCYASGAAHDLNEHAASPITCVIDGCGTVAHFQAFYSEIRRRSFYCAQHVTHRFYPEGANLSNHSEGYTGVVTPLWRQSCGAAARLTIGGAVACQLAAGHGSAHAFYSLHSGLHRWEDAHVV